MRSLITGARAGINDLNSSSLALCQAPDFLSIFARSANCIRSRLAATAPAIRAATRRWADQASSSHTTGNHGA